MVSKRKCEICGSDNKSSEIFTFDELLRDLEIGGRYAHPVCVMDAQAARRALIKRQGTPRG